MSDLFGNQIVGFPTRRLKYEGSTRHGDRESDCYQDSEVLSSIHTQGAVCNVSSSMTHKLPKVLVNTQEAVPRCEMTKIFDVECLIQIYKY